MGLDAVAKQLVGHQVRHFVGNGLAQEVLLVFPVELQVEAQQFSCRWATPAFCPRSLKLTSGRGKGRLKKVSACW